MKKVTLFIAILAAAISCTKEPIPAEETTPSNKQIITATVDFATKVTAIDSTAIGGSGMSGLWEAGDKFYAIQGGSKVVTFNLTSGAGTSTGIFTAETEGVTASTEWKAVFGSEARPQSTPVIYCSYSGQTGKLNDVYKWNYITATGTGLTPSFNFQTGSKLSFIMRIKLPAGVKTIEYAPAAWFNIGASANTTTYYKANDDGYDKLSTKTITLDAASAAGDTIYVVVPAVNHSYGFEIQNSGKQYANQRTGVILTFMNNDSDNATASNGTILGKNLTDCGGQIATFDLSSMPLIKRPRPSDAIRFQSSNIAQIVWSNFKQVASSLDTYWAPFNVGASYDYEAGGYYHWGETFTKSTYTFVSSTLRGKPNGSNNYYNILSSKVAKTETAGEFNYYTISQSRYDVARVKWGNAWRMAHVIECQGLLNLGIFSTTTETVSGNKCVKIDNKNGSYIRIPLAGYYNNESGGKGLTDFGTKVCFWLADQNNRSQGSAGYDQAYHQYFPSSSVPSAGGADRIARAYGMPVRAVLTSSVIKADVKIDVETSADATAPSITEDK